jgi:hypothetical protein
MGNTMPTDNCKLKNKESRGVEGLICFPFGGYPCEGILTLYITFNAVELN